MSEKDYQKLYRLFAVEKGFDISLLVIFLLYLALLLIVGLTGWMRIFLWVWAGVSIGLTVMIQILWRCPRCGTIMPERGYLSLFSKQHPYTNERSQPYRCPGCGVEIDMVAVVHPECRPPRC